ncbi:type I-MYXAN CRISPR-associated protein Cas6/Cmx6 [Thioalkalivibrio denitrificans]|uniref:Type I-MYXAN CRISPR-associated protein Cas6/Cmx6 n=1 Tax=Thioalkalivibrio denitrificans TaxID=108003 RepID=A0A1V3NBL8_9GAMM|nr:type I-MYXAN CRISPR-associated protein Cas6/Cmx6 [Thioalkalivibrio denitrificans]OOG22460.1 type I-MYXAN CRISPR-associated protein Cas6/Cmx6 [Thioalkalivibrio denitrificans]
MFWDESPQDDELQLPDDVVDVSYRIDCRCLPLDHAHALTAAVREALPWLEDEDLAGIHLIHGAESGNGWYRPQDPEHDVLHLSRRARFRLRLPRQRLDEADALVGRRLDVDGYELGIGEARVMPLAPQPALLARYVVADADEDEARFLQAAADALRAMDIPVTKLLCGRSHVLRMPEGDIFTRSLMVADLEPHDSVMLQRAGIGPGRLMGCGLFIGHKDIAPVQARQE